MADKDNKPTRRDFLARTGIAAAAVTGGVLPAFLASCKKKNTGVVAIKKEPPDILLCYSWSHSNIGDIGITPGMLHLLRQYIPDAKVTVVANAKAKVTEAYLSERFPGTAVVASPFNLSVKKNTKEFQEAFDRADIVLYNSGTTLSFGRWERNWNRTMPLAMPLFMARDAGKAYGIYCQSFEKFAWPSDALFVPLLSKANFVFARDGDSLEYLRSLDVKPPVMRWGPDATFAFNLRDEDAAGAFMKKHDLKPREFITITIRTSIQGFLDKKREEAHAAKMRQLIETWVDRTGHDVLICPEVEWEIEPARKLILERLPKRILPHIRFKSDFWLPDEAFSVYARAEAIVSMEQHSIILALAAGTPVILPRFLENGRKAWMLRDLGIEEWLFDIDTDPEEKITAALLDIHNDYDAALGKVKSAMHIVHEGQRETMAIVRKTIDRR